MKGIHGLMCAVLTAAAWAGGAVLGYRFLWARQLRWRAPLLGMTAAAVTAAALVGRCLLKTVRTRR